MTHGGLAPDGRHWFTDDHDRFSVFDSATGARRDIPHPGFAFAAPYQWLGDDTIAALAVPKADAAGPISLVTCRISTNSWTVTARDIGTYADVVIPTGTPLGD